MSTPQPPRSGPPISRPHSQLVRQLVQDAVDAPRAFREMALRTRSPEVLDAIAALALPGSRAVALQEVGRAVTGGLAPEALRELPLQPGWASELAALSALQVTDRTPDLAAAWGLWQWAARDGDGGLPVEDRDLRAQVAWMLGGTALDPLRSWVGQDDLLGPDVRAELRADLANPWAKDHATASSESWEEHLAAVLGPQVSPVQVPAGRGMPFERLSAPGAVRATGDRRVTVILTCYRPDTGLLTAVSSLVAQTWQEWELIIVDDGSGPAYEAVLAEAAALDDRVRLIRLEGNVGTYAARNAALRSIRSTDFVTFHDSDDWSHPQRLELTVDPLRADPDLVGTTGWGLKTTSSLHLTRPGYRALSRMAVSLVVRHDPVCTALGFFDPVRRSADKEFKRRIMSAFPDRLAEVPDPVGIVRRGHVSLSAGDHSVGWRHHSRRHYHQAYQPWHRRIRRGETDAFLDDRAERAFWAPPRWLRTEPAEAWGPSAEERPGYDLVLVADYSRADAGERFGAAVRDAARRHDRVGLLQIDGPLLRPGPEPPTHPEIQREARRRGLGWVYLDDDIEVARVVVLDAGVLHPGTDQRALWGAGQVAVTAPSSPDGMLDRAAATRRALSMFGQPPTWQDG